MSEKDMSEREGSGQRRRYLSLFLPRLPTDLRERGMVPEARTRPRAVVVAQKGALRLCAVNAAAAALGLESGLALADARARHPGLDVSEAEPAEEARMLGRLADACERYTPLIALDGRDGLLLDVTGCAHLFGGEAGLVRDLLGRVARSGFTGRAALAATSDGAFALARFAAGRGGVVVPAGEDLAALLAPLPLAALRRDVAAVEALARLGLRRVGDLYGKPRAPLAARFGAELLARLDAALGHAPGAVDYRFPPPAFCAERALAEPVERVEDVLGLAAHLAATLAGALERHGMGARRLDLTLFRVDGRVTRLAIGTSRPLRDPAVVRRLFAEKVAALSSLDPGFGFDLLRLAVREAAPLASQQEGFGGASDGVAALDALVDRLATRFGGAQVQRLVQADQHLPEAAGQILPAQGARGWGEAVAALAAQALSEPVRPARAVECTVECTAEYAVECAVGRAVEKDCATPAREFRREREGAPLDPGRGGRPKGSRSPATKVLAWPGDAGPAGGASPSFDLSLPGSSTSRDAAGRGSVGVDAGEGGDPPSPSEDSRPLRWDGRGEEKVDGAGDAARPGKAWGTSPELGESGSGAAWSDGAGSGSARSRRAQGEAARGGGVWDRQPGGSGIGGGVSRGSLQGGNIQAGDVPGDDVPSGDVRGAWFQGGDVRGDPGERGARDGVRAGGSCEAEAPDLDGPARPLRLFAPPEPVEAVAEVPDGPPIRFRWRRMLHQVVRAEGPERIAAPWWEAGAEAPTRDYFRVETLSGARFWLFRAGLYGHGAGAPVWFLHGLFG